MDSIVEDLSFSQADLEKICREPEEDDFTEGTGINKPYGIGGHLRRYAGLPEHEPLAFTFDHGVPFEPGSIWQGYLTHGLPGFLAGYPERAAALRERTDMRVLVGGFGIHYALRILKQSGTWRAPEQRRGTIAFPHKSTASRDRSFDFEEYARWLAALPEKYQPVCVCIYWKDFLKGRHQPYLDLGMPVVSCGHYHDPEFLFRFIDLCTRFEFALSNAIAGSYVLSVVCGCHFIWKDFGSVVEKDADIGVQETENPGTEKLYGARLKPLAPFPPEPHLLAEQRALANYLTGADRVLAPEAIRKFQRWCRRRLLRRQPSELSFADGSAADLRVINPWLPRDIRGKGWAGEEAGIVVKPVFKKATLEVFFKISAAVCDATHTLTVIYGNSGRAEFQLEPGRYAIALPLPRFRECPVTFRVAAKTESAEGAARNHTALRFLGWRVVDGASREREARCVPVMRKKLPEFVAVPEGW